MSIYFSLKKNAVMLNFTFSRLESIFKKSSHARHLSTPRRRRFSRSLGCSFRWIILVWRDLPRVLNMWRMRKKWGLPRCKNLTRFSLFVSFCFAVRYCLKCFCFLCFTSSVSFTGSYTEVKPKNASLPSPIGLNEIYNL